MPSMETLLDALVKAIQDYYKVKYDIPFLDKRLRQARAFRNRILRMDAERIDLQMRLVAYDKQFEEWDEQNIFWWRTSRAWGKKAREQRRQLAAKDARIAELEEVLWFYGNEYNYQGCVDPDYQWTGQVKEYPSDVVEDEGAKAREVLQKESNQ